MQPGQEQAMSVESSQPISPPSQDMDFTLTGSSSSSVQATEVVSQPPSIHFAPTSLAISSPPVVVEMRNKSPQKRPTRPSGFEQARKSRSLENLLNTPDNEAPTSHPGGIASSGSGGLAHVDYTQTILNASELYGQPVALDIVKTRSQRSRVSIRHAQDTHQSSSSISSSGSHNSLHGSLEIIQVS